MSYPTLAEIYEQTRAECGDKEVAGGQIYTDAILLPHVQGAVRAMWSVLANLAAPRIRKTLYYTLPANTSVLNPGSIESDYSQLAGRIGERGGLTSVAISNAVVSGNVLTITCSVAHGFSTGDVIVLEQIGGLVGANIMVAITVTSTTAFTANGVVASGTYTSGGFAVKSANEFAEIGMTTATPVATTQSVPYIAAAYFDGMYLRFNPASENRQLRIPYYASAVVPTTGTDRIMVNDSIDFLSMYAAWKACSAQGAPVLASALKEQAVGNGYEKGINGGALFRLVNGAVRAMQQLPPNERGPAPFREQNSNFSPF